MRQVKGKREENGEVKQNRGRKGEGKERMDTTPYMKTGMLLEEKDEVCVCVCVCVSRQSP